MLWISRMWSYSQYMICCTVCRHTIHWCHGRKDLGKHWEERWRLISETRLKIEECLNEMRGNVAMRYGGVCYLMGDGVGWFVLLRKYGKGRECVWFLKIIRKNVILFDFCITFVSKEWFKTMMANPLKLINHHFINN